MFCDETNFRAVGIVLSDARKQVCLAGRALSAGHLASDDCELHGRLIIRVELDRVR